MADPGWYPDPDGAPGTARWWDGTRWSDLTTPTGPGVSVQAPPSSPAPSTAGPWSGATSAPTGTSSGTLSGGRTGPGRPRIRRGTWAGAAAALAVVVLIAVALVVGHSGSSGSSTAAPESTAPAGPTFPPGTVQIVDRKAGIAYPYLGGGWFEWNLPEELEVTSTAGEYFTTQPVVPGGGEFIAQVTSGPLRDGFGWTGDASLQRVSGTLADTVRAEYYPLPNTVQVVHDEARTVDGHAAWLHEFDLSWKVPGYQATGERAALLLVDVGTPTPALLYISIPDTHAELYADVDTVLAGVHVL